MRQISPFAKAVYTTVRARRLFRASDRVAVALSGGPDSLALLAALLELAGQGKLAALTAIHVDHGLRPESADDAKRVAALCERLGVALAVERVRVPPGNVQAQARRVRYAALREAARRQGATRLATGHTRTDQAETVLLRLLRGAGSRGLAGIPPRRGIVVRPLIDRTRAEVMEYLETAGLQAIDDPSNASPRYLRNRVRHELLPVLRALSPSIERSLARGADLARADDRVLERLAAPAAGAERLYLSWLASQPVAVRRRAVRLLWRTATGSRRGLSAAHVEAILALCRGPGSRRRALPSGFEACAGSGALRIAKEEAPPVARFVCVAGRGLFPVAGGAVEVGEGETPGAVRVPLEAFPVTVRTRLPGDRFRPERGTGSKKLKAWLIDRKVPRPERDRLLVVCDREGRILWIPALGARGAGLAVAEEPGYWLRVRGPRQAVIDSSSNEGVEP